MNRVEEIVARCDGVECGYKIAALENDIYAFVWGNVRVKIGEPLPEISSTDEKGIEVFDSYDDAERAWVECGIALQQSGGESAAREMLLTVLPDVNSVETVLRTTKGD